MQGIEILIEGLIFGILIGFALTAYIMHRLYSPDTKRSRDTIKSIASDVIQSTFSTLTEQSKAQLESIARSSELKFDTKKAELEGIIKPLNETLTKYQDQVNALAGSVKSDYGGIAASVSELKSATADLNSALKNNQQRGRWGEIQLKRIAEISGMSDYCDFSLQESSVDNEERVRPDMIVKLPGNRTIIVDAKSPISEYIKATEAKNEEERNSFMKNYASQIRGTVKSLSSKSYQEKFSESVEFVIMFIPGEAFFSAAMEADHDLLEYSVSKKVVLASPLILISLLKSAAMGWQEYRMDRNREEIVKLGKELYSRINKLVDSFTAMGKSMNRSVKDYNALVSTLESRVLVTARKMSDLGVGDGGSIETPDKIEMMINVPKSTSKNNTNDGSKQDTPENDN